MAPPEPLPAPGKIAHHGYEYADCALLTCVLPSNAAATTKSTMIGLRVIVSLPVVVPCFPFILAGLLRRRNERTGAAHHRRGGQRQPSARAPFRPARPGSSPPPALPPCPPFTRAGFPLHC